MSKQAQQQKIQKTGNNMAIEHTIVSDDSLLPTPAELEGYKAVHADIIPWLMKQTELEQSHRHKVEKDKIKLLKNAVRNDTIYLIFLLLLVLIFIGISAFFVYLGKDVSGSIFGICGIVGAVYMARKYFNRPKQ